MKSIGYKTTRWLLKIRDYFAVTQSGLNDHKINKSPTGLNSANNNANIDTLIYAKRIVMIIKL
ncbi:hypothetical protein CKY12_03465 [Photorhabdus sp. S12-55]|nr:hypothetical protein PluDJC_17750 [Photorhabdus laumondii subsp. laumondii]PQQ39116.1 hypothetical protein C6H68_03730 [Photorhabdus luminescens]RAW72225.1 hypothetical protein CKY15_07985 [Photorhabdus sp. S7-51]RAW78635.1 hypothetical protein CKY06_07480 [Photorhabdus sp. S15-56]RAW88627.1 hypothetical protein CKY12_03465 [Photorhabdus sp. S12-55]